jgi:hypothetical protein
MLNLKSKIMSIQQDWVMDARSHKFPKTPLANQEVVYLLLLQNIYDDTLIEARANMIKRINRLLDGEIENLELEISKLREELEHLNEGKRVKY